MAAFLSLALYTVFIGLDAVYTPQYFLTFLFLRLGVMAAVGVILLLLNRIKTSQGVMNLALVLALVDAAGIAVMIYILGGFLTSYYQGLNIIVMGMIVLIPLAFRYTIYLYVSIWFMYAVPSVIKYLVGQKAVVVDGVEIEVWRFVINNLTFLTSIIVVGRHRLVLHGEHPPPRAPQPPPARGDHGPAQGVEREAQEPRRAQDPVLRQRQPRAAGRRSRSCWRPSSPCSRGGWGSSRPRSRTPSRRCSATATSCSSSSTTSST
ncbi:MAG: hypothetical protein MZU79_06425 [Anaerotruncus sp.]|nr:hypothetical protein [Anaerotruncus sp.]